VNRTREIDQTYKYFKVQLDELFATYIASQKANQLMQATLNIEEKRRFDYDENIEDQYSEFKTSYLKSPKDVDRILNENIAEIIYVRLISILEVYLINLIKSAFVVNKDLFKRSDKELSITHAQLLSISCVSNLYSLIINQLCRDLSSQGFDTIIKFYRKYFGVDIKAISPGRDKMLEYHEHRHLLIHRLGRTDHSYRSKHNTTKSGIYISDDYLMGAFLDFLSFGKTIKDKLISVLQDKPVATKEIEYERGVIVHATFEGDRPFCLERSFAFWAYDDYLLFGDICKEEISLGEKAYKFKILGTFRHLRIYLGILKSHMRKLKIQYQIEELEMPRSSIAPIQSQITEGIPEIVDPSINDELFDQIKKAIPDQPWKTGMHLEIASTLGVSAKSVRYVIKKLIHDGVFKKQKHGIVC
jgi:hypothetical protein